jgi:hypothetical protein
MRAQSALEYLMTYGWAILIVIIVGAALYALGVFNPGTFTGQKSTGFSAVQMDDFRFDTISNLTLRVGNRKGRTIYITAIQAIYGTGTGNKMNATGNCGPTGGCNCGTSCATLRCMNRNLGPNEVCQEILGVWSAQAQGSSYTIDIRVNYTDIKTGVNHTDYGTVSGSVETV